MSCSGVKVYKLDVSPNLHASGERILGNAKAGEELTFNENKELKYDGKNIKMFYLK